MLDGIYRERGDIFCPDCMAAWKRRERISYLSGLGKGGVPPFLALGGCFDMVTLIKYRPFGNAPPEKLIYHLKRKCGRRAIKFIGGRIKIGLDKVEDMPDGEDVIVTFVPRKYTTVCKYGVDQAERLAQGTAQAAGYKFEKLICRKELLRPAQKKLDTEGRRKNAKATFVLSKNAKDICQGKTVILVDDLLTTGATLGVCTSLIYSAGATRVICATVGVTA